MKTSQPKPRRRVMSITLFVCAVLLIVLALVLAAASDRLTYLLLGAALAVGGVFFYRRGK